MWKLLLPLLTITVVSLSADDPFKIVHLSRENLAGNHQGNGTRLEAMLWSRSGCLRVNVEGQ